MRTEKENLWKEREFLFGCRVSSLRIVKTRARGSAQYMWWKEERAHKKNENCNPNKTARGSGLIFLLCKNIISVGERMEVGVLVRIRQILMISRVRIQTLWYVKARE